MSNINIMDASAILAYLKQENGEEIVESALDTGLCWVTTVNVCEVLGKLCEKGMPVEKAEEAVDNIGLTVMNFDIELARFAAALRVRTKPIGASLGDRACLALAERASQSGYKPIVFTADQSWTKLKWPFKISLIRPAKKAL